VAEGDRKRIGSVIRLWDLTQPEQQLDHRLHLLLIRPPAARDGLFDLVGCVLRDGKTMLGKTKTSHTASLTDRHGGCDVVLEKSFSMADSVGW